VRLRRTIVRNMNTEFVSSIDWLLPQVRRDLLGILLGNPAARFYLRELQRLTGLALGSIRRELAGLTQAEIILQMHEGNRTYYQANRDCPIFPELRGLMAKTSGLADVLRDALLPLADKITVAFVYGSQAGGRVRAESDVDVLVVGDAEFGAIVDVLTPAQDQLGREVNPSTYATDEFRQKMVSGHHFLRTVFEGPKIFLIGDEYELGRLAQ
jgi:uncharacterized protein